jgi:hypothetical protein
MELNGTPRNSRDALNLGGPSCDFDAGGDFFWDWRADMSKAAYFTATLPASIADASARKESDFSTLIPVALFSGIGLLVSLIAILSGVQGVWI